VELRIRNGLRVEEVDGEAIVLDCDGAIAHRVSGEGVVALRLASDGITDDDIPADLEPAFDELVNAGIVQVEDHTRWTRRKLLVAGGTAWAAATVTTFALASPASVPAPAQSPSRPRPP
jgi:hypothetical protein